jgi:HEAT repeat protein
MAIPAGELIARALAARDGSEEQWTAIAKLHLRDDRASYEAAVQLCASGEWLARQVGIDILSRFGCDHTPRPFLEETMTLLLALAERETFPDVRDSLAAAFGELADPRGLAFVVAVANDPDPDLRWTAAIALTSFDDDLAFQTLLALSADVAGEVRNWATFGLGQLTVRDTPQLREVLVARLDDPHDEAREEGVFGLAVRGDVRAIPVLLELQHRGPGRLLDRSLVLLGELTDDPRIPPALAQRWPDGVPDDLRQAAAFDREMFTLEA